MVTFEFNPELASEGWTQSEITTLDDCGEKWFYRYHELLRKKNSFSWPLIVGSAFHATLEQMYATAGKRWTVPSLVYPEGTILSPTQATEEIYWNHVLEAMTTAYAQHYAQDFENFVIEEIEEIVEVEYMGFKFTGMIDLRFRPVAHDGAWIMDHKTTSRLNLTVTAGWDFRFQFMFYLWLKWKQMEHINETSHTTKALRGYYINGVKKPELRLGKKETVEGFAERCRQDMLFEPQKYFYREKLIMTADAMRNFEEKVLAPKITRLQMLTNTLDGNDRLAQYSRFLAGTVAHNLNTDACQRYGKPCEFLELCRYGSDQLFGYEQRSRKHEELEAEES